MWESFKSTYPSTLTRARHLVLNHLFLLWVATDSAPLHHVEGAVMAEVKNMNMSSGGIVPEIIHHPHAVLRIVEKAMTQNVANRVETEARGEVVTKGIDVKRAKSASQCI